MAAAIGYKSADMIYKIERDATEPSWEQADKWAAACGKLIGDILPNSGNSSLDEVMQPLLAAMAGMDVDDIKEQVLILASQARLNRNAILRRGDRGHTTNTSVLPYHPSPTSKDDVVDAEPLNHISTESPHVPDPRREGKQGKRR